MSEEMFKAITRDGIASDIEDIEVKRVFGPQPHEWEILTIKMIDARGIVLRDRIKDLKRQVKDYEQYLIEYGGLTASVREAAEKVTIRQKGSLEHG